MFVRDHPSQEPLRGTVLLFLPSLDVGEISLCDISIDDGDDQERGATSHQYVYSSPHEWVSVGAELQIASVRCHNWRKDEMDLC